MYPSLTDTYIQTKKAHVNLIKNTKKEYYQKKISNSENNTRSMWNVVSELTNKHKNTKNIAIKKADVLIETPNIIATEFNNYFINTPYDLVNNIQRNTKYCEKTESNKNDIINSTLFLQPFTEQELLNLLNRKMKNKKSAGADDIPAFVLRRVLHIIIKPLAFLVNLSFSSGIFPVYLKTGKVTPIYKKEDSTLLENYRPVTTPDSLSKAFEYAFCDRFLNFLNKENILTPRQHGFRLGKSTSTALLTFYDELINFIDAGECPAAIFCDLSRAFDCVNHKKLLYILESYGLRGVSLSWISSFLTNRSQYVSLRYETEHLILNATSEFRPVQMGVPQGSVLGPVLFLLYVNQLESAISHPHFIMYADDVSLLISAKNSENVINKCEQVVTAASSMSVTYILILLKHKYYDFILIRR